MSAPRTTHRGARAWTLRILAAALILACVAAAVAYWLGTADDEMVAASTDDFSDPALIQRGAYLARAGNCMTCHTARGGEAYAGGRAIPTPFGTLYGPNITPHVEHGIGSWSADDFWRALHNGKSPDGELLYPAFPYPSYTTVSRADSDAIYAFLLSLPPVARESRANTLRFPYNQRIAIAFWRALYFRPEVHHDDPAGDEQWNRGAYLVNGLTHCAACHTPRNGLGATRDDAPLAGGMIPMLGWYAPPLTANSPEGLGDWSAGEIAELMHTGISPRGTASGPMGEVVFQSLQYLSREDVHAIAAYLKTLPVSHALGSASTAGARTTGAAGMMALGAKIYEAQCLDCHGANGEGKHPAFPRLAGNLSVIAPATANAIRTVLNGGYAPGTSGNPRPYGMPPFRQSLSDSEVAAVVSYIRSSWGNQANPVSPSDVRRYRTISVN